MSDNSAFSGIGEYVPPRDVRQLLDAAELEYSQIIGRVHVDDTQETVDERLRALTEFATAPDSNLMNYMDLVSYMQRRTGLPVLLCVYHVFFLSESAGAIIWPQDFDAEQAETARKKSLKVDFASAVSQAVLGALLIKNGGWRGFNHELIGELLEQEDKRRASESKRLYDTISTND